MRSIAPFLTTLILAMGKYEVFSAIYLPYLSIFKRDFVPYFLALRKYCCLKVSDADSAHVRVPREKSRAVQSTGFTGMRYVNYLLTEGQEVY